MNRSFIRPAALAFAVAALAIGTTFFSNARAQGASFSFSDPNCASFTLTGSAGAYTLSCASLTCSIAATPSANVLPGNPITLTATCVPTPTGSPVYTWTLLQPNDTNCPLVTAGTTAITETATLATAAPNCTYQVAVTGATNGGGSASQTVSWSTGPPPPPTNCAVSISTVPNPLTAAAGTATPSVTGCTPSTGLTYSWTKNSVTWAGQTTSNPTDSLPANSGGTITNTYVPTICTGPLPASCVTLTGVTATQPGTGGGGINCTGYANTHVAALTWSTGGLGGSQTIHSQDFGGFGKSDAFVVQFTTPSGSSNGQLGSMAFAEYGNPPANRWYKVSTTACDFAGAVNGGTSVQYWYTLGANAFGAPVLQPSTTYYVNIHNDGSCGGSCNIIFTLNKPPGT